MTNLHPVLQNDTACTVPHVIAASDAMKSIVDLAERAAQCNAKVLITGESGVGKDVVARYIHGRSARMGRPYVPINCAGLTETLLESELFGHVRGSFTGAYRDKVGRLQLASGGTLFLDEVEEMSLRMQALLLRFLDTGELQSVGADRMRSAGDVRIVAATNRDLADMVAAGQFREDLLYRLRVIHIHVPPLRERREDIAALVKHFIGTESRRIEFSDGAFRLLQEYRWPGNVRELHNVIEQVTWSSSGEVVGEGDLPASLRGQQGLMPKQDRRHQVADDLYQALVPEGRSFWQHVYPLFQARDLTRHDLRELVKRGLGVTRGDYRALVKLFGMPSRDYKRFLNFLASHDCSVDFRAFRASAQKPKEMLRAYPPERSADRAS